MSKKIAESLLDWYKRSSRPLPWRINQDPYRVWISEVMLQQTTVAAVVPYYDRFLKKFPTVTHLARAKVEDVLELWSGLGYYSRARNLHSAAQKLSAEGFRKTHRELIELPGFGPYVSRAVSSIAFNEPVAAIDGNLIRVLSRLYGLKAQHWTTAGRSLLQSRGDSLMAYGPSSQLNQALMDLGSDVCSKQNPRCGFCPLAKMCVANKMMNQNILPLSRPRPVKEIWEWKPLLIKKQGQIQLIKNESLPFLKKQWLFPGLGKKLKARPKRFMFKHTIMHYEIYVTPLVARPIAAARWVKINELPRLSPFSILYKAL